MKFILLLLFFFLQVHIAAGVFCFPVCGSCSATTYDKCIGTCQAGTSFSKSGSLTPFTCVKTTYNYYATGSRWQPVGVSPDIPVDYKIGTSLNVTLENLGVSERTRTVCADDGNAGGGITYQYFGNLSGNDIFFFNHSGVTGYYQNVNYYMVRVIYGFITLGDWTGNQKIITTFITNTTSSPFTDLLATNNVSNKLCSNPSKNATYRVINREWRWNYYNDQNLSIDPLQFSVQTDVIDPNKKWGVMNIIVSVRLCHPYCLTCTGDGYYNVCNSCNYLQQPVKKSGKTCYITCASGYGDNSSDPLVCIVCKPLCKYCFEYPQFCLNCNSGYFLYRNTATNYSCLANCPTHYYANSSGNASCLICDPGCLNCTSIPTKCTACYSGTYLYNFQCLITCPDQYFPDDPTLTCKPCNKYCFTCAILPTNCSVCDTTGPWISYLKLPNACTTNCGDGFFADTNDSLGPNLCLPCDIKCLTCAINSTYCFTCNATYYLLDNTCDSTCPFPQYFTDNATWKCLSCAQYCVTMTMDLYWKNSLREELVCDLTFSEDLSWGPAEIQSFLSVNVDDPLISLDNFNFVYEAVSPRIMRLTLSPKGYTFIYNVTFNFKTKTLTNGQYDFAANMYRFSDLNYDVNATMVWFLIQAPSLSDTEKKIMDSVSDISQKILQVSTLPYVQQIKKTGIFSMIMGGAQITSTACLINSIPSQNFYEGMRFWASFVMFDVPAWQQDSRFQKNVVGPKVQDLIQNARLLQNGLMHINNRTLFDTSTLDWRFKRTGYTSFFIYDTYINLSLMVFCWILLAIAHFCITNKKKQSKILGYFYSFTLKVHEITVFYISISTLLEWIYFDAASFQRWMSFGCCIFFNIYFLAYQLYIYYDMINYPLAVVGNKHYDYYSVKYGSLLKNIRFAEYDPSQKWSVKHWLRPYNYEILSFYKTFLMMISLPIFYSTKNAQISVLLILQFFQIIRFIVVWPFKSKVRNILKLSLECALMLFFMSIVIQSYQVADISLNNPDTLQKSVEIFYKIGWVGFAACWIFNLGNIFTFIFDGIAGCIKSNREMMDEARKIYYMEKIQSYENENQDVPLSLVNKWVKLGNLNDRKFEDLPELNLKVEHISIQKCRNGFEIQIKKIIEVSMNRQLDYHKQNNLCINKKIHRNTTVTKFFFPQMYTLIEDIYNQYKAIHNFEHFTIKTFQEVNQSQLKPNETIILDTKKMTQKVELIFIDGKKKVIELAKLLPGFPIKQDFLKGLI